MANGSLPSEPVVDQPRARGSLATVPLSSPPSNPTTDKENTGDVTVKPIPPDAETAPPARSGVGPQPQR